MKIFIIGSDGENGFNVVIHTSTLECDKLISDEITKTWVDKTSVLDVGVKPYNITQTELDNIKSNKIIETLGWIYPGHKPSDEDIIKFCRILLNEKHNEIIKRANYYGRVIEEK